MGRGHALLSLLRGSSHSPPQQAPGATGSTSTSTSTSRVTHMTQDETRGMCGAAVCSTRDEQQFSPWDPAKLHLGFRVQSLTRPGSCCATARHPLTFSSQSSADRKPQSTHQVQHEPGGGPRDQGSSAGQSESPERGEGSSTAAPVQAGLKKQQLRRVELAAAAEGRGVTCCGEVRKGH